MTFFNTRHPALNMALERAYHQRGSNGQGSLRELSDAIDAVVALLDDAASASRGQAPAQAAPDVSGYVNEWTGGICTADEAMAGIAKLYGAQAAPAAVAGPSDALAPGKQHDDLFPPLPTPDLRDVGTTPKDIHDFLRGYATEYAKAALAAPTTHPAPQQEAASVDLKTMELAESVGLIGPASRTHDLHAAIQRFHDLICANATIKAAQMAAEVISKAAPQQESQEQSEVKPFQTYGETRAYSRGYYAGKKAALAQPSPASQGDALPREELAWMVVQEACETEPADEDDPECIRILRRDLKSSVLAAFLRHDAARAAQEESK